MEVDAFSLNLLLARLEPWGIVLFFALSALGCGVLIVGLRLRARRRPGRRGGRIPWGLVVGTVLIPVVVILTLAPRPPLAYGRVKDVTVLGEGPDRLLRVGFWWRTGGRGASGMRQGIGVFTDDGTRVGFRRVAVGETMHGHAGGVEIVSVRGRVLAYDERDQRRVGDLGATLDDAYGAGGYRVVGVDPGSILLRLPDGRSAGVDLASLVPTTGPLLPRTSLLDDGACRATFGGDREPGAPLAGDDRGLLGARPVTVACAHGRCPCTYPLAPPSQIVVHQATAFGPDAHALSVVPSEPGTPPSWTVDLSPLLRGAPPSATHEVLSPEVKDGRLCFWLLRAAVSLREVCVGAGDGLGADGVVVF